jgi:hypothetical protein
MQDVIWLGVCLVSIGIMAACWWRDSRTSAATRRGMNRLVLELAKQVGRLERERTLLHREVGACRDSADDLLDTLSEIEQLASGVVGKDHDDDWTRPTVVGEIGRDPLYAEISLCGPAYAAVYMRTNCERLYAVNHDRAAERELIGRQISSLLCMSMAPVPARPSAVTEIGLAAAADVEEICDAVRRFNESFHNSKGGGCAGIEQEAERTDRDPDPGSARADQADGGGDPRGQGADRCGGRPGRACPSQGGLRGDSQRGGLLKTSRKT